MLTLDDLAAKLAKGKVQGDYLTGCCPAHEDHTPSLTGDLGDDGRILVHCHAGCTQEAVLSALGVDAADLYPPKPERPPARRIQCTYPYHDATGALVGEVVRYTPKGFRQRRPGPDGKWEWKGARLPLWKLPEVIEAVEAGRAVWVVEGEKDALNLQARLPQGEVATTCPGGAGKWRQEHTDALVGADVIIVRDRDDVGTDHAAKVAEALADVAAVRVCEPFEGKDLTDHLAAGHAIEELVQVELEVHEAEHAVGDGDGPNSWTPVENPASFDDITPLPPPSILTRDDGKALLYPGAINGLHGESGEGKSWLAKLAAGREMAGGRHVLYVDHEDAYQQVTSDLVDLGFDYAQFREFWHYIAPEEPLITKQLAFTAGGLEYLTALEHWRPSLVVLDGVTDGMNLHSLSPSENDDYATWRKVALSPAAKVGAAVLTVDHVTKNNGKGYAIGAQHKRAGMTGGSYEVKVVTPYSRGHDGMFKVICRKAKRGHWRKGEVVAECHVTSHEDGSLTIDVRPAAAGTSDDGETWAPTYLMDRVSEWMEAHPGEHTLTDVRGGVKGRAEWVDVAIETLVEHGYMTRRVQGRGKYHAHLDRYHDGDDLAAHAQEEAA